MSEDGPDDANEPHDADDARGADDVSGADDSRRADDAGDADAGSAVRRGRFSGGPARGFMSSLADDERIFAADLAVDRAHVVMLAEQDIVDDGVAGDVLAALEDIEAAGHGALPDGEDVQEAIETAVIERVGPAGGKMHTARSRNDEVAADIRYRLREDLLDALGATVAARERLLEVAEAHTETLLPGFTHLQYAQPVTVGFWVASYEEALARDTERLLAAYARTNRSPLGAGAFGGVAYPVDRERTADLLGFDGVVENAMDAASTRDFLLEATTALAALATTLSGLAEDLVVYANKGYVDLDDDYASTSSIMPQKKNPDSLELVRARAGDAAAAVSGLLTTLKGLPRAYNRDLQRATGYGWDAVDAVTDALEVATGAVATATWDEAALEAEAGAGFSTATGVADRLAQAGVPFRTAHEVVARAATDYAGDAPDYDAIDAAARTVLDEPLSAHVDREVVEAALDPRESVAMRASRGGPAPDAVAAHLSVARDALDEDREALAARREAVAAAAERRQQEVERYV
ncbi:MAG: argininosuccinate lyase [Haloarculaceae archaeon]